MNVSLIALSLVLVLSFGNGLTVRRHLNSVDQATLVNSRVLKVRAGALSPAVRDAAVSVVVAGESMIWLKLWSTLASNGALDSKLTRKIIHTGSAPLFIAHWPLYSHLPSAKYFAAAVPFLQTLR